jgi:hypothetical protein
MSNQREQLVTAVSTLLHADRRFDAAKIIAEFSGLSTKSVTDDNVALELCYSLLQWCLDNDHYEYAAQMLWTPTQFDCRPRCTRMVWDTLKKSQSYLLMGAASMSKSYGGGGWHFLDWIRDPKYTNIKVVGPSEQHLKDNIFTHLVTLHQQSTLPMPGTVGDLFIGLDPKARKSAISGIVIPLGKKAAGRLQGAKLVPRKNPHPIFGPLSRMRIFVDEFEEVPVGIWKDIDNVFANLDGNIEGFKIGGSFNPRDITSKVAERAEPPCGWDELKPDTDETWRSKRGWQVLRLDANRCENIIEGKVIYPGLQTKPAYDNIVLNAGGLDSPGYWTMCRAVYPRAGSVFSVISSVMVNRMKGEFLFAEEPEKYGGVDLSLEGLDAAEFAHGRYGKAAGYRLPPMMGFPNGKEVLFVNKEGKRVFRNALQVDGLEPLPTGDTMAMMNAVRAMAEGLHILPRCVMMDRTGNGAGVHDIAKELWDPEVRGVNYSEGATERKILVEDSKTADKEYERAVSELVFALKKWGEFGFLRFSPEALTEQLIKEMTTRRYKPGKLTRVESKPEYKARGNTSPNKFDAVTLLLHAVRIDTRAIPSASDDCVMLAVGGAPSSGSKSQVPMQVCVTNKFDDLD